MLRPLLHKLAAPVEAIARSRQERWATRGALAQAALRAAHSSQPDEDARRRLRDELGSSLNDASAALQILALHRDQFDMDRAYRLLSAAVRDVPVLPISPDRDQQFSLEDQLGRMPLTDAFAVLAQRQPMLLQLEASARATGASARADPTTRPRADSVKTYNLPRVSTLLGHGAPDGADPLLKSPLALSIASHYLEVVLECSSADSTASYFSSPTKKMMLSAGFGQG
jgi:hypothetical protein